MRTWSCPYWRWEKGRYIYCDGCRLHFKSPEARNDYVSRFCANVPGWEGCTVAQTLLRHTEEEPDDENDEPGSAADPGRKEQEP